MYWYAGTGGNKDCGGGSLTGFVRTSIEDKNRVCPGKSKPCIPSNTYGSGEGMELHVYEDTLDLSKPPFSNVLSNATCTELAIYVNKCCRSGGITTGSAGNDFIAATIINIGNIAKCAKQYNNSPEFGMYTPFFVCCNQPVYSSMGARDTIDNDSLSFALAPALANAPKTSVTYSSPFSYQFPVTSYCPGGSKIDCTPQPTAKPPRGFFLNTKTGDLTFTPVKCDEMGVLVIEITEWRQDTVGKMQPIAKTYRDVQIIVKDDCGYNNPPVISGISNAKITAGEKICMSFTIEDEKYSPYQTANDTVKVAWQGDDAKATWSYTPGSTPNKGKLDFCWTPNKDDASRNTYKFAIEVDDQHCPKPAITSRTFEISVLEKDSSWFSLTTGQSCNGIKLQGFVKKGFPTKSKFAWEVYDTLSNKLVAIESGQSTNIKYLPKGTYRAILKVSSDYYGYSSVTKVFSIITELPSVKTTGPNNLCMGSGAQILATTKDMELPVVFSWTINNHADSTNTNAIYNFQKVDSTTSIKVQATDNKGCIAMESHLISIWNLPELSWKKSTLNPVCGNAKPLALENELLFSNIKAKLWVNSVLKAYGNNGLVDSVGMNQFQFNPNKIDNAMELVGGKQVVDTLTAWLIDSNGCKNSSVAKISVIEYPIITLKDQSVCQNVGKLELDSLIVKPTNKVGSTLIWKTVSQPSGVNPSLVLDNKNSKWTMFFGSPSEDYYAGWYLLELDVKNDITGCSAKDTAKVVVETEPVLSRNFPPVPCEGLHSLDLLEYFTVNSAKPNPTYSFFKIQSWNGDTTKSNWGTAAINGQYLSGKPSAGYWILEALYKENQCATALEIGIQIHPTPVAKFSTSPDNQAPAGLPFFTTFNQTTISDKSIMSYQWNFDYPLNTNKSSGFEPQITYPSNGAKYTVQLIAKSKNDCFDTAYKTLEIVAPNGVNKNAHPTNMILDSRFVIRDIEFESVQILIFDESGKKVAQLNNNTGIQLPAGMYFYRITLGIHGEQQLITGKKAITD